MKDTILPVQISILSQTYTYKLPPGLVLSPKDTVVIPFGRKGLVLGIVESVNEVPFDTEAKFQYKWIAAKVELDTYYALLASEPVKTVHIPVEI